MLDGLDGSLMMMLMHLTINSCSHLLMLLRVDMLLSDWVANIFIDDSIVLSILGDDLGNGGLSFLHVV